MKLFTIKDNKIVPFTFQKRQKLGELLCSYGNSYRVIRITDEYREKINNYLMEHRVCLGFDPVIEFIKLFSVKTSPEIAICTAFNDYIPFKIVYNYDEIIESVLDDFIASNDNYSQFEKETFKDDILQSIDKEKFVRLWIRKRYQETDIDVLCDESNDCFWVYRPIKDQAAKAVFPILQVRYS